MNNKDIEKVNKYKIVILLFIIYLISVFLYFIIGSYDKNLAFIPDERLYIQASKALANRYGLYYNGVKSSFQKIFYSLIISPAFLVKNLHIQIKLINLLGVIFGLSSIFPIYLISRKLNLDRIKSIVICLFYLTYPIFLNSLTFMSETAFLPLWLWSLFLIMNILETEEIQVLMPVILGVVSYLLYMCKEVGVVAIPVLFFTKAIFIIKQKESIKGLVSCFISAASFLLLFLLGKFLLFDGKSSNYSYDVSLPNAPESNDKNPIYYLLYAFLFYLGYIILVNCIFPIFIRTKEECLNKKIVIYLELAVLVLICIVVYRISLNEDYGLLSPRLHLRYFEPLFIPYTICFLARVNEIDEKEVLSGRYVKMAFIIYLIVLFILPGLNPGGELDATSTALFLLPERIATHFFLGSPRMTVFFNLIMKIIIILIVLFGVKILEKNRKHFYVVFMTFLFITNIASFLIKYIELKKMYYLPEKYVDEMQIINDGVDDLQGKKLIVVKNNTRLADITVTLYDINDTDLYLLNEEYNKVDKIITLKAGNSARKVNIEDYDYIVYDNNIWEDDERESIPSDKVVLSTDNFFIYDNK